jgi:hypothetical protein
VAVLAGFAILSAFGIAGLRERLTGRRLAALTFVPFLVVADLIMVPLPVDPMFPVSNSYRMLARLPRGPVAEFPFYWRNADLQHHAMYMLLSTYHWQPMINGYSDIFPRDYAAVSRSLASFPSREALEMLRERGARYVIVDYPRYSPERRASIAAFMRDHGEEFRELQRDLTVVL